MLRIIQAAPLVRASLFVHVIMSGALAHNKQQPLAAAALQRPGLSTIASAQHVLSWPTGGIDPQPS